MANESLFGEWFPPPAQTSWIVAAISSAHYSPIQAPSPGSRKGVPRGRINLGLVPGGCPQTPHLKSTTK